MDLPHSRTGRTSPSYLMWEGKLFVLTLNAEQKKRRAASITAITGPQLFLFIWRIADTYRGQEFFNKQSSVLKWMKVKMLRMNTF